MERMELEKAVLSRLDVKSPIQGRVLRKSIRAKSTENLEDILKRMKEAGKK